MYYYGFDVYHASAETAQFDCQLASAGTAQMGAQSEAVSVAAKPSLLRATSFAWLSLRVSPLTVLVSGQLR